MKTHNPLTITLKTLKYISLLAASLITLLPIITTLFTSFKTDEEYMFSSKMAPPNSWLNFDNFVTVWRDGRLGGSFGTSFLVVAIVIVVSVLMGSMIAYALNRFKFPGAGLVRNLFLFATLIPGIAMQVTVYKIMMAFKLVNTLYGYVILQAGTDVISIYIFLQYFENLSNSLDESAILDGCTYFGVFFKILLPLLQPAVITVMTLKGVGVYNEYYMANLYLQDKNKYTTISTALYTFTGPFKSQYNLICAGVILTMLPILILFILCQKQVYNGLISGAIKG